MAKKQIERPAWTEQQNLEFEASLLNLNSMTREERLVLYQQKAMYNGGNLPYSILPPLPPRDEWGGKETFSPLTKGGKPRCQTYTRMKLRFLLFGADAQCEMPAQAGEKYCSMHLRRCRWLRRRKPATIKEEMNRYRKYVPKHLLKRFLESEQDPRKLSLDADIDLVTARVTELMQRLNAKQSGLAWKMVSKAHDTLRSAMAGGDPNAMVLGVKMLGDAIRQSDYPAWEELVNMILHRKTLVESERKRLVEQAEVISLQEVMALVASIQDIIHRTVTDYQVRMRLAAEFRRLVSPDFVSAMEPIEAQKQLIDGRAAYQREMKDRGCYICRQEIYRERNKDQAGYFTCPSCGQIWTPDENKAPLATVIVEAVREEPQAVSKETGLLL